jgi:hypothetical protein
VGHGNAVGALARDWGAVVGLPTVTKDGGGDWVTGDDRSREN